MIDPKKIEQIARQVHESMPKGIREFGDDVEKKIRQTLQAQLVRLDLVSREEFDVQTQVPVSYTHLTLPTTSIECRSRWSPYH